MTKPKMLTPEKAGRELARVLDQVRREKEDLAEAAKERKGRIAALEKRARELVDIANERTPVQVEIDTESDADRGGGDRGPVGFRQ